MDSYHNVMQDFIEPNWAPLFPSHTIPSQSLRCSSPFYNYLTADGVFIHSSYSRDKSSPLLTDSTLLFPEIQSFILQSLQLYKSVFVKINWKSGKDCKSWLGGLECTHIEDVMKVIKCSSYIAETLEDYEDLYPEHLYIILKEYQEFDRNLEFRCFVNKDIISICQRSTEHVFVDMESKEVYRERIEKFVKEVVKPKFGKERFVVDLFVGKKGGIKIIDVGPWREFTNPLLFGWEELEGLEAGEFRLITNEEEIMYEDLGNYNKPNEEEMKWLMQEITNYKP